MSEIFIGATIASVLASVVSYLFSIYRRLRRRKKKIGEVDRQSAIENLDKLLDSFRRESAEDSEFPKARERREEMHKSISALKKLELKEAEDASKRPFYVSIMLFIFVAVTVWLFYARDGMEGAKTAWSFGGPIMGAITGFWLSKSGTAT